jgi:protein gp37
VGEKTKISWCKHTFNPWWGCWKIAPECKHCYAEAFAHRFVSQHGELWKRTGPRRFFGDKHWNEPRKWNAKAKAAGVREAVFVGSMCDWAEVHPDPEVNRQLDAYRGRLFAMIRELDSLDWMLLSKRVDDIERHLPWARGCVRDTDGDGNCPLHLDGCPAVEVYANVSLGVTAGTRDNVRYNVRRLRAIRAAARFVSCEPMLEEITAEDWNEALDPTARCGGYGIDLLIVGEESGRQRRAGQLEWVRTARDAAARHGVGFHLKQWHEDDKLVHLPVLDGVQHSEMIS